MKKRSSNVAKILNYCALKCNFAYMLFRLNRQRLTLIASGEARNLQVGGHVTIFEFLGGHKLKNLKICLSICTYVRGFRNFWVGLCPPGPYSGFATAYSPEKLLEHSLSLWTTLGPALNDMEIRLNATLDNITIVFGCVLVGYTIGALISNQE
jgi:hypothetical protein